MCRFLLKIYTYLVDMFIKSTYYHNNTTSEQTIMSDLDEDIRETKIALAAIAERRAHLEANSHRPGFQIGIVVCMYEHSRFMQLLNRFQAAKEREIKL